MKKNKFYLGRLLLIFGLLIIICVIYGIVHHNISLSKLKEVDKGAYKVGKLLQISEDRIEYVNSYNLNSSPFSIAAIIDDKYYVSCFRVGYLKNNESLFNIVGISKKPFSKSIQENYLTRNNYIPLPMKSIHNPYSLLFNTSLFPVNIELIKIYFEPEKQSILLNKEIIEKIDLGFVVEAKNISFSFNGDNQEDMILNSFYDNHKTNILFIKDDKSNVYIICLSPKIDIIEDKRVTSAPFKTLKELREAN